jgi:hypothetical protein
MPSGSGTLRSAASTALSIDWTNGSEWSGAPKDSAGGIKALPSEFGFEYGYDMIANLEQSGSGCRPPGDQELEGEHAHFLLRVLSVVKRGLLQASACVTVGGLG